MKVSLLFFIVTISVAFGMGQTVDLRNAPKPGSYPVHEKFKGKPAKVVLDNKRARLYRTVIREGAKQGPNFAGHYTGVAWGCGLGAFSMAVVDAKTGKVYFPPFECVDGAGFGLPFVDALGPIFRKDSRMIVFYGCTGDCDRKGVFFYVFEKGKFRLVHFARDKDWHLN